MRWSLQLLASSLSVARFHSSWLKGVDTCVNQQLCHVNFSFLLWKAKCMMNVCHHCYQLSPSEPSSYNIEDVLKFPFHSSHSLSVQAAFTSTTSLLVCLSPGCILTADSPVPTVILLCTQYGFLQKHRPSWKGLA